MTKTLAGLLLAISTTASAQFQVENNVEYSFIHLDRVSLFPELKLGESVYVKDIDFCMDEKGALYAGANGYHFYPTIDAPFVITSVGEGKVAITHISEKNGFLLNGPAVQILHKLKQEDLSNPWKCGLEGAENIRVESRSPYKVESLFGHISYEGLAEAVNKEFESRYGSDVTYSTVIRIYEPRETE
ncbi:hypothetical protein ONV78_19285 [Hahella sp. CR1]|uniref:hypothetical protein n=1 Tax=Hahella sp. CR1 TaxID=2992807 RepID=UPI002442F06C|nr:hypothetical protein [Hahella sp. CR1]MDG9669888.1 hypothetical protein [Hahella sp. CR1]